MREEVRDKMISLARALLSQTNKGALNWEETDNEDTFLYPGGNSSLTISMVRTRRDEERYRLTLSNSRGTPVEALESAYDSIGMQEHPYTPILRDLFDAARGNALQVETVLDEALREVLGETP